LVDEELDVYPNTMVMANVIAEATAEDDNKTFPGPSFEQQQDVDMFMKGMNRT
jgi:hypothetical protein